MKEACLPGPAAMVAARKSSEDDEEMAELARTLAEALRISSD